MSILISGITIEQFYKDLNKMHDMDVGWDIRQLSPHGRLIDADALRVYHFAPSSTSNMPNYYHVSKAQIDNAPTIIEAEED